MASGINKIILVGNLGRNPDIHYSKAGMPVCTLSLAVSDRVKGKGEDESWNEVTEWFRVTAFGRVAETAAQFLAKGRQVYVEGRLKTEKYQGKDGVNRTSVEVIANELKFLGARKASDDAGEGTGLASTTSFPGHSLEEEMPF